MPPECNPQNMPTHHPKEPQSKRQKLAEQGDLVLLSAWNPLDHLRLLWWLLMAPQTLNAYQEQYGKDSVHPVGNWLASTLTWLPIFIPTLALGIGTLPSSTPAFYQWTSTALILLWLLTGWFGGRKNKEEKELLIGVGLFVVGAVGLFVARGIAAEVTAGVAAAVAAGVVLGMAVGVALEVTGQVAKAVLKGVARGAARGVRLILLVMFAMIFTMIFAVTGVMGLVMALIVAFVMALVVESVLAGVVVGVVAGIVAGVVEDSIKSGQASWLSRLIFTILLLDYAFLIWYAFLGGAEVLQSLGS